MSERIVIRNVNASDIRLALASHNRGSRGRDVIRADVRGIVPGRENIVTIFGGTDPNLVRNVISNQLGSGQAFIPPGASKADIQAQASLVREKDIEKGAVPVTTVDTGVLRVRQKPKQSVGVGVSRDVGINPLGIPDVVDVPQRRGVQQGTQIDVRGPPTSEFERSFRRSETASASVEQEIERIGLGIVPRDVLQLQKKSVGGVVGFAAAPETAVFGGLSLLRDIPLEVRSEFKGTTDFFKQPGAVGSVLGIGLAALLPVPGTKIFGRLRSLTKRRIALDPLKGAIAGTDLFKTVPGRSARRIPLPFAKPSPGQSLSRKAAARRSGIPIPKPETLTPDIVGVQVVDRGGVEFGVRLPTELSDLTATTKPLSAQSVGKIREIRPGEAKGLLDPAFLELAKEGKGILRTDIPNIFREDAFRFNIIDQSAAGLRGEALLGVDFLKSLGKSERQATKFARVDVIEAAFTEGARVRRGTAQRAAKGTVTRRTFVFGFAERQKDIVKGFRGRGQQTPFSFTLPKIPEPPKPGLGFKGIDSGIKLETPKSATSGLNKALSEFAKARDLEPASLEFFPRPGTSRGAGLTSIPELAFDVKGSTFNIKVPKFDTAQSFKNAFKESFKFDTDFDTRRGSRLRSEQRLRNDFKLNLNLGAAFQSRTGQRSTTTQRTRLDTDRVFFSGFRTPRPPRTTTRRPPRRPGIPFVIPFPEEDVRKKKKKKGVQRKRTRATKGFTPSVAGIFSGKTSKEVNQRFFTGAGIRFPVRSKKRR